MENRSTCGDHPPTRWRGSTAVLMLVVLLLAACSPNGRNQTAAIEPTGAAAPVITLTPEVTDPLPAAQQTTAATTEATLEATQEQTAGGETNDVTVTEITANGDRYIHYRTENMS